MREISLDELGARAAELCARRERTILGLVGPPGAGKSTLAELIVAHQPQSAIIVPMDGYHLANSELQRLGRSDRKGAHDTFDSSGYVALLRRLRAQGPDEIVYAPQFRREWEEAIAGAIPVLPEHRLIVTEGNYLLLDAGHWRDIRPLVDEVWYIDVDWELRTQRLVARHVQFGRAADVARDWVARTDEPNARLIEASRGRADAVVSLSRPAP